MSPSRIEGASPRPALSFVGKLAARADFVRQNIREPIGVELERWVVKSMQNMQLAKAELPSGQINFVFSAAGCDAIAIGAMAQSKDQVGRRFPLSVFTSLPVQVVADCAALPLAFSPFLSEVGDLLTQAANLELDAFRDGVQALLPPYAAAIDDSRARVNQSLQQTAAHSLLGELFPLQPVDSRDYGLFTFLSATQAARNAAPGAAPTVLDCPISAPEGLAAWLELAQRRLGWRDRCPSFMWNQEPRPRLLLSLGYASDQLLHFVAEAKHPSARLWPLVTERAEAAARASAGLHAAAPALVNRDSDLSIDRLWAIASTVRV